MQIMLNRIYNDWTCWESAGCMYHGYINAESQIPWQDITQGQFRDMSLFVLSEPYGNEAAFNAWTEPEPHYNTPGTTNWADVNDAVFNLLNSPVTLPWESNISVGNVPPRPEIRLNVNVQYFVSFDAPHDEPPGTVWTDVLPGGRLQFYGTYPMPDN